MFWFFHRELSPHLQRAHDGRTLNPEAGDVIRGSGGLRKIRWSARGRGKRGGLRIIYYLIERKEIYLLLAYPKNKQENLTNDQLRLLRSLVQEEIS